ncbi:rhodanese-like domain-containing protein [Myxococcota bacterium]|nr:rhodanese-like domain-containing protein [Myxococcota bacterium]
MDPILQKIRNGAYIVDVRTVDEYLDGAYPGAVNIPVQEFAHRAHEIPMDRSVVLYCASGGRSAMAARYLKQNGHPDVVNAGGLDDMPA